MENNNIQLEQNYVEEILGIIREGTSDEEILNGLEQYHDNDIADVMELLDEDERKRLYDILDPKRMSEIFAYIEDIGKYVEETEPEYVAEIIENMDSDDAVDALEDLDDDIQDKLVNLIDDESSRDINLILSYDDDEIGSMMTTNFIQIKNTLTVKQAMRTLVSQAEENDNILTLYVCDENDKFFGAIDLKDLIVARDYTDLMSLISTSYPYVRDHDLISDSLERIKDYAEDSIPVLGEDNKILGVITSQDIVEAVDEELGEDYAKLAGLTSEEDLNEPLLKSMKKRMPWLIILLFLGMMVSSVVGLFEGVIAKVAIIVSFQSLILGMAGNVGTQSLAVTIRVLMDEQVEDKQRFMLIFKEMRVGLLNGLILGTLSTAIVGTYLFAVRGNSAIYSFSVSGCVGAALVISMMVSSLIGTAVPLFLHKIKIDPAVASGPLITTVNDLVAVITYYGLSWLFLLNL